MSNDNNNLNCDFAETLIDVLYGEANAHDKQKFDSHLKNCAACSLELKDFGTTRDAVLQWREIEFATLATPEIIVPYAHKPPLPSVVKAKRFANVSGFFDIFDVRKFWVQGSLAFAALTIVAVLFVFGALLSSDSRELAKSGVDDNRPNNTATALVVNAKPQTESTPKPIETSVETVKTDLPKADVVPVQPKPAVKTTSAKSDVRAIQRKSNVLTVNKDELSPNVPQKARFVPPKKSDRTPDIKQFQPNISVLPEDSDEDETPRLTDLLDEVSPAS